jgi:hypothetical protein
MGEQFKYTLTHLLSVPFIVSVQGESKKTDTFDIQMNNKGVSFF